MKFASMTSTAFAVILAHGAVAQVVGTQQVTGTSLEGITMRPDQDNPRTLDFYTRGLEFGACAYDRQRAQVDTLLAAQPNSALERGELERASGRLSGCNVQRLMPIETLARGTMAEARFKSLYRSPLDEAKITASGKDTDAFLANEVKWNKLRLGADRAMIDATNCLVAVQPVLGQRVLATRHGSPEEATAMDVLFAKAPSCAGASRPKRLSRSFLRAFIADSLDRLSQSEWRDKFLPKGAG